MERLNEELAAAKSEIKTSKSRNCDGENIHSFEFLRPSTPLEKGSQPSLLPVPTRTDGSGPLRRSPSLPCKLRRSSSLPRPRLSSKGIVRFFKFLNGGGHGPYNSIKCDPKC